MAEPVTIDVAIDGKDRQEGMMLPQPAHHDARPGPAAAA
jgi:hypothetical protein